MDVSPKRVSFVAPEDLPLFAGHFPGNPILPGVVQLDCVVSGVALIYPDLTEDRVTGISSIKFKSPVKPGESLTMVFHREVDDVEFTVCRGEVTCAQGRVNYRGTQ